MVTKLYCVSFTRGIDPSIPFSIYLHVWSSHVNHLIIHAWSAGAALAKLQTIFVITCSATIPKWNPHPLAIVYSGLNLHTHKRNSVYKVGRSMTKIQLMNACIL